MFNKMCEHSNGWRPEDGVPDLAMMSDITAEGININLRTRYLRNDIYTFSGSILIAVNPYKPLDIYGPQWISRYRDQRLDQTDPHIFALTEAMYMNLVMQDAPIDECELNSSSQAKQKDSIDLSATSIGRKNQACVISGESGAGKTETTKFILSYLCSVTPNKSLWMEHQILEANTILEAFGNAKTVRNDNSSRFGKFIQICFDSHHQINGCIIQDYLLEKSRITYQSVSERNYHIFYQLLAAGQMNQELRKKFHLMPSNFYDYLNKTNCYDVDGIDDCAMFDSLRTAMSVLNMEQESCDGLFGVISAILWLGNMQFKCDETDRGEQCHFTESDLKIIQIVAELLGIDEEKLKLIMLKRQINVRGNVTEIPFGVDGARDNRNGMAKALYSRLFTWIVNFINASTNPSSENTCFLGILDIFGFENFDNNSFEQLCINYANEKLHKFFNYHMFAMEQELYKREGIEFCDINYTDNTPCLELLERPPNCILRLLSEECRMPKGTDQTLIDKLHTEFSINNPNIFYDKGRDRRKWSTEFSVRHFAGPVTYRIHGFLSKNQDTHQSQLLEVIETSGNSILRELAFCNEPRDKLEPSSQASSRSNSIRRTSIDVIGRPPIETTKTNASILNLRRESSFNADTFTRQSSHGNSSSRQRPTVADTFRHQLSSLVDLLASVNPCYVRCIKPNLDKSATSYDDEQVLVQLKYLGMTDLVRIRREGYPIHLTKHQFVCRYRCLISEHCRSDPSIAKVALDEKSLEESSHRMISVLKIANDEWKIGKSRVFLRSQVYQSLERKRSDLFIAMATVIQSNWRRYVTRRHFLKLRYAAIRVQETFRTYKDRLTYLRKKRAVLTIQAYCRGMFAREIANALREIKRVEQEKIEQAALEERKKVAERRDQEELARSNQNQTISDESTKTEITITESADQIDSDSIRIDDCEAISNNVSPAMSAKSWTDRNAIEASLQSVKYSHDDREMEALVQLLERHGISIDALAQENNGTYADFGRIYEVLGSQLQTNRDSNSFSPSINDDDRCSFATNSTNDGDSISCSGQSQISSTIAEDQTCNDDQKTVTTDSQESSRDETINHDAQRHSVDSDRYDSNSIDSIASLISSNSTNSAKLESTHSQQDEAESIENEESENLGSSIIGTMTRTSTFTGGPVVVAGSKLVSNGRPLTRIEEEPNSIANSPAKMSNNRSVTRPQSLFKPKDEEIGDDNFKTDKATDIKRRRVERKIVQVQQEELNQPINPTTAGVPTSSSTSSFQNSHRDVNDNTVDASAGLTEVDGIYDIHRCSILDFANRTFNNHPRDSSGQNGVIRTLTRKKKSVDGASSEYLSKEEMLSYNPHFTIPNSHIKMHDPHSAQLSCSIFKNLCKYMAGECSKAENEIRIIQSIVRNGIEKIELRDEIYIQLIRQLTNNPNHDYSLRLWILLGLVSAGFPASKEFSKFLTAYIRGKPRKDPSITCHAQFCLDNLQTPRLGARKYPPSPLEIYACKNLVNLTCKVLLLDGRQEILSVHPCDTALDILNRLAHQIHLQSIEGWALYESYTPGASKYPHPRYEHKGDFERAIKSHYFMADLIASWQDETPERLSAGSSLKTAQKRLYEGNFKLTLKKKIFRGPKIRNDPVEINLLYSQAVYNVVRKDSFFVDENLALSLAGLQAQAQLGNAAALLKQDGQTKKGKSKQNKDAHKPSSQVYEVENYICLRLRNSAKRSKKDWCHLIAQAHKQFHNVNEVFCKMRYLSMVIYHCPLYGTATYEVTYKGYQVPEQNLMLGINAEGLVLIRSSDKALISAYRYTDICVDQGISVYSDGNIIEFRIRDNSDCAQKCLSFETTYNEEIALLMVAYSPSLSVCIRGSATGQNCTIDHSFEQNALKRKSRLKMTLEDRMRTHQEVQNTRRAIIKSGKLRKPTVEENNSGLLKHTIRRFASNKIKTNALRQENTYGTIDKSIRMNKVSKITTTASDYSLYGASAYQTIKETEQDLGEVAGATATPEEDELTRAYPHRYWAYTKSPLQNSLLTIFDPDLEEVALSNFNAILTYSGLIGPHLNDSGFSSSASTLDSGSIDSGIASQQSYDNFSKTANGSPSSVSSGDIYDVCPKRLDEKELIKLAQGILDRCLKKDADILKNEFFLQLIKQTTDYPDPNSEINKRHWQLMALACSVTYPSDNKILSYLYAHLRRCCLDQVTDEGQYAQFTLRSLQGTLDTKGRSYAPSEMEILSTINCRRVYARVYFLEGIFQAVEFDPCATIAEVVEQIKQKIGLRPDSFGYALFQPLDDDCEQVLKPEEKVGDAIAAWEIWQKQNHTRNDRRPHSAQQTEIFQSNMIQKASLSTLNGNTRTRPHKFVFKRYLFLDNMMDLNDPIERELLYHQTITNIKEDKFPILEQEAIILCALKAQIEYGDYTRLTNCSREDVRNFYKQTVMSLMPPHTFNNLPIPAIAQQHQALRELSTHDAKKYFFNLIKSFGTTNLPNNPGQVLIHYSHVYDAKQTFATAWPSAVWIVINQSGLQMLVARSRRVLATCDYRHILDYNSSNNYLMIITTNGSQNRMKYTFYTKQAQQIAQQMKDYIVITSATRNKKKKSVGFNLKHQTHSEQRFVASSTIPC